MCEWRTWNGRGDLQFRRSRQEATQPRVLNSKSYIAMGFGPRELDWSVRVLYPYSTGDKLGLGKICDCITRTEQSGKNMKVLILSPFLSQSLSFARLLARSKKFERIDGGCLPGDIRSRKSKYYDSYLSVSGGDDLLGYELVIPGGANATEFLVRVKGDISIGQVRYDSRNINYYNKLEFLDLMGSIGVEIPRTWNNLESIGGYRGKLFVKPEIEGAKGCRMMVSSPSDLPLELKGGRYIYQEYIGTKCTYAYCFLAKDGIVLDSGMHKELLSYPREGGSAAVLESCDIARIKDLSTHIVRELRYSGWGMIEYKWCNKRNDFVIMELNPKFWASIEFILVNNPAFVKRLFGISVNRRKPRCMIWPDRLICNGLINILRHWRCLSVATYVWEPRSIRELVAGAVSANTRVKIKKRLKLAS